MAITTSSEKPAEIVILSVQDDIKKAKCKVRYAFRYNIQETTTTVESINEETGELTTQEVTAWQYEEIISETEFDLVFKSVIPDLLKTLYEKSKPILEQNIQLASVELPKEISVGE
ncbi:hypothetical protein [Thermosipho sp. 1074]|uniref:hypothetical protein n=1 Tax=Thermosipho sp. 1074 TaxID=1643331 RepID=UPI0009856E32|nr:hypothetical protein [Thermosipho sp. 1074]OOC42194.1 hypothetical protein XO08_07895 [Thermosipho sp. 1074]